MAKRKWTKTHNDLQNMYRKLEIEQHQPSLKSGVGGCEFGLLSNDLFQIEIAASKLMLMT